MIDPRMPVELTDPIRSALRHCAQMLDKIPMPFERCAARDEAEAVLKLMDEHTAKVVASMSCTKGENVSPGQRIADAVERYMNARAEYFATVNEDKSQMIPAVQREQEAKAALAREIDEAIAATPPTFDLVGTVGECLKRADQFDAMNAAGGISTEPR